MNYENVKAQIHPKSAAQRQRTLPYGHQCSLCIIWNIIFYYKLERKCSANAFQFVIIYYKLGRSCSANAFQFVIIYYKLGRNCITYAFQFVIIYYKLERYYKLGRNNAWCHMRGQPDRTPSASSSLVVGRRGGGGGGEGERTPRGAQTGHLGSTSGTVFYCNFCRVCRFVSAPVSIIHWLICGIHNIFRFKENIFRYKFATNIFFLIQSWSHIHVFKNLAAKP